MATFILDTGMLVGCVRGAPFADYAKRKFAFSKPPNVQLISIVSKGEAYSLAIQFRWGEPKRQELDALLRQIPFVDITDDRIIHRYAEIDAFSQGKHPEKSLPDGMSSRNMGKNDLWIAATGSVLNATLLSIDHDFDHLHGVFLDVVYIDQGLKGSDA